MKGAIFSDCQGEGCRFLESDLRECQFISSSFTGSHWQRSYLGNIVVIQSDMGGGDFSYTTLIDSWVTNSTIANDFFHADMTDAAFTDSDFSGKLLSKCSFKVH